MSGKGPTRGVPPVKGTAEADAATPVERVKTEAVRGVDAVERADAAGSTDPIARVAQRLRAQEIGVDEAVRLLIEDAISRQVGRALKDAPRLAGELRKLLAEYAERDPYLAAKIRKLTVTR